MQVWNEGRKTMVFLLNLSFRQGILNLLLLVCPIGGKDVLSFEKYINIILEYIIELQL